MRTYLLAATCAALFPLGARAEVDLKAIDASVSPQDDFYRYASGEWLKTATIPAGVARWGSFDELRERNWENVRALCEAAAAKTSGATASERLVGDFFASGMDEAAINAAGLKPIQPELDRIAAAKTPTDLLLAMAHLKLIGVSTAFAFTGQADAKDSDLIIAQLRQGGLSLPGTGPSSDRDYYFNDDEKSQTLRAQFVEHVGKLFELAGEAPEAAKTDAGAVLHIETELARVSLHRAELRVPAKSYHKIKVSELAATTGDLDWPAYFAATGAPKFDELNLAHPDFFKGFAALLKSAPATEWQAYLRWKLLHDAAPALSAPFENENHRFYTGVIQGVAEKLPRWRRVAVAVDANLGDALGQLYVAKYFPPEAKARVLKLVEDLRAALADRINASEWMDAPTKLKALAKLNAFGVKMGYPDKWKDYSSVRIDRGPYVLNVFRASEYEVKRNLAKIGQPADKTEFSMTPPTVNARYSPPLNDILFPAGILQPPFFDANADDASNYGAIGAVIGHEMSHGFDDQGRQYDAKGNLVDWWTPESAAKFKERSEGIVKQFSGYTVLDGLHLKGELTQGENIADLGGLRIAYAALQKARAGKPAEKIDGFTPEQRFFLSWARLWREKSTDADQRRRVNIDPHSPGLWRVNGPCSNLDEFAKAFAVPEGAPMRRPATERVNIW